MSDAKPDQPRPRFLSLTVEWFGILVFAVLAGQFLVGLMSLLLSADALGRLVWLPTPVVIFFLLSLRLRGSAAGRFRWPGPAGLWWSLLAAVPGGYLGAVVGVRLYPALVGCAEDCDVAAASGLLGGASLVGLTAMVTVLSWRGSVAADDNGSAPE